VPSTQARITNRAHNLERIMLVLTRASASRSYATLQICAGKRWALKHNLTVIAHHAALSLSCGDARGVYTRTVIRSSRQAHIERPAGSQLRSAARSSASAVEPW